MGEADRTIEGWLTKERVATKVRVRFASRFSLWVQADEDHQDGSLEGEGDLSLKIAGKVVDLGLCKSFADEGANGDLRRFAPAERLHNFESLFSRSRVEVLESSIGNVQLLLGHKEHIDPGLRSFVSDLTYDLNVYKNILDKMDLESRAEPVTIREHVQARLLATIGGQLSEYLDEALIRLEGVISSFSESEQENHGYYFRKQLWSFLLTAPIMARTNLKPRGYSGDSEMMRMIYLNNYMGESTFGKVLHKHAVGHAAAQAVRNRRVDIAAMIHRRFDEGKWRRGSPFRVLSVACGPAFEMRDLVRTASDCEGMHLSLLDQDQQALMEAGSLVGEIESSFGVKLSVDFIRESVRTMLFTPQLRERWGKFHFIYSMGLFDYLTPPVALAVLRKLYSLLEVGGEVIVGNFARENASRTYMEYWLDWKIIHRTTDEFLEMAANLPHVKAEVLFDATGIQMFLRAVRQAGDGEN